MRQFVTPIVCVSKCLGFDRCRYNGVTIETPFVELMRDYVEFRPVCPEVEIGLGVPREPIRLIRGEPGTQLAADADEPPDRLVQPATGRDLTDAMNGFLARHLDALGPIDGFVLKYRSPTCGLANVKRYASMDKGPSVGKTKGLFGRMVRERFPGYPAEDEGRLLNFGIREHFLTALYALATFRTIREQVEQTRRLGPLVDFQADHKLLLMGYSQKHLRQLGGIVANAQKRPAAEVAAAYEPVLREAMRRRPPYTSMINVLQHALGYFSKHLTDRERKHFLDTVEAYRAQRVPLSVPVGILRSWTARFEQPYLARQAFFDPYPHELTDVTDSGKGRDLR